MAPETLLGGGVVRRQAVLGVGGHCRVVVAVRTRSSTGQ